VICEREESEIFLEGKNFARIEKADEIVNRFISCSKKSKPTNRSHAISKELTRLLSIC